MPGFESSIRQERICARVSTGKEKRPWWRITGSARERRVDAVVKILVEILVRVSSEASRVPTSSIADLAVARF
jgi:hypothetical protein